MLLIDTREPPAPARAPRRPPTWFRTALRLSWRLILALALVLASGAFPPLEAYAVLLAACVLIGRGLTVIVKNTPGLSDYHQ